MEGLSGKRIFYIITKSNWGGAQNYVFTLAARAKEAGAQVSVILGGSGLPGTGTGLLTSRLEAAGIRTLFLPTLVRDISPFDEVRALRDLIRLLKTERPDVIHLNSSKAGFLGAIAGRLARVPRIVFTAHGWPHREPRSRLWRLVAWKGSWLTVFLSHKVIVVSDLDRRTSPVLLSRRKIVAIHNGIAPAPLLSKEEARDFLAPSLPALRRLPKWILIPAELTRTKGIDYAIHAFAGVSTNIDDSALVIVGDGEEHAELAREIERYRLTSRAFLLGFVPDVRQYLSAGDIFLLPSRKEGFPFALLEAGQAGLPVIASAVGGVPEIIEHEKNGLLVRPGDIDGLADAMTRLLTRPDESRSFGTELHRVTNGTFSEKEMVSKTFAQY